MWYYCCFNIHFIGDDNNLILPDIQIFCQDNLNFATVTTGFSIVYIVFSFLWTHKWIYAWKTIKAVCSIRHFFHPLWSHIEVEINFKVFSFFNVVALLLWAAAVSLSGILCLEEYIHTTHSQSTGHYIFFYRLSCLWQKTNWCWHNLYSIHRYLLPNYLNLDIFELTQEISLVYLKFIFFFFLALVHIKEVKMK